MLTALWWTAYFASCFFFGFGTAMSWPASWPRWGSLLTSFFGSLVISALFFTVKPAS